MDMTPALRESMIREAAYALAERRGFSPGHELDDWFAAEHAINNSCDRASAAELGTAGTGRATDDPPKIRRENEEVTPSSFSLSQTQARERKPRWFRVPREQWLLGHLFG